MKKIFIAIIGIAVSLIGFWLLNKNFTPKTAQPTSTLVEQKLQLKVRFDTELNESRMVSPYQSTGDLPAITPYKALLINDTDTLLNLTNIAVDGDNALIDWVLVSLINESGVVQTRSGIVQADGDIVGMDGISVLTFTISGDYFISVKHRNNLAFRTEDKVRIENGLKYFDFTNNSVNLHGQQPLVKSKGYFVMIGGDANSDGSIDALDLSIFETQNGLWGGYGLDADFNLDGSVDALDAIYLELYNGLYEDL